MTEAVMTRAGMKLSPDKRPGPRILLVEDDPASQAFLVAVLESLPARVDAANSCAQARQLCVDAPGHALWLIDANLPDGNGVELLAALRLAAPRTVAVAHTASCQREILDGLIAGGFSDVLVKPLTAATLQAAVCRALGDSTTTVADDSASYGLLPDWDDIAALRALNGQATHVTALRRLFIDELPLQRHTISTALAAGEMDRALDQLHRLRASCGFVGATRLGSTVQVLQDEPDCAEAFRCFEAAASDLLAQATRASGENDCT